MGFAILKTKTAFPIVEFAVFKKNRLCHSWD